MDEGFCGCVGEGWTEAGDVLEVKSLGDVLYALVEGEGLAGVMFMSPN